MNQYNYQAVMNADIRDYLRENYTPEEITEKLYDRDEWESELYDLLWIEDSVTGNGSGSYTFDRNKAKAFVFDNLELVHLTMTGFCVDGATIGEKFISEDWEYFDVSIRCYLLGEVLASVLDEVEQELQEGAAV